MEIKVNEKFKPFSLGQLVATPATMEVLSLQRGVELLARHTSGDWGLVEAQDWKENDLSTHKGFRILSVYWVDESDHSKGKVWIITEADRSSTCILLPSEY